MLKPRARGGVGRTHGPALAGGGGADRDRTGDLLRAKQVLSQLSYSPLRVVAAPERGGSGWS